MSNQESFNAWLKVPLMERERLGEKKKKKDLFRRRSWKCQHPEPTWYDNNFKEWINFQHKALFVGKIFPLNTICEKISKNTDTNSSNRSNKRTNQHSLLWSHYLYRVLSCTGQSKRPFVKSLEMIFLNSGITQNCIFIMWQLIWRTGTSITTDFICMG